MGSSTRNKRKRRAESSDSSIASKLPRQSFSSKVILEFEDSSTLTVDEQILVDNSEYFKTCCENPPSEIGRKIQNLPELATHCRLSLWLFIIRNPAAHPDDLVDMVNDQNGIAHSPRTLLELCRLWTLARSLVDRKGQNRIMDTIFHITSDERERGLVSGRWSDGWHEVIDYIIQDEEITPDTALYRWLVDHVAQCRSLEPKAERTQTSSMEFIALVRGEIIRLRQPKEKPRLASAYHLAIPPAASIGTEPVAAD